MINELYLLTQAIEQQGVTLESWHPHYREMPVVKKDSPCVRIVLSGDYVSQVESIEPELCRHLRKYGNNQATWPGVNLASLYRITDEEQKKELKDLLKNADEEIDLERIRSWCVENNWGTKLIKKYKKCVQMIPEKLEAIVSGENDYPPVVKLIQAMKPFRDPRILHRELERVAFEMLENHTEVELALRILFYVGKEEKTAEEDSGSLSVFFDSEELEDMGDSSATLFFTKGLNQALQKAEKRKRENSERGNETDAFGRPFFPSEEPMPSVKLAGGFDAILRTMFHGQPCQSRYGRIENDAYPLSEEMRSQMKDALKYLSAAEMKEKTWIAVPGRREILFAYPSRQMTKEETYVSLFQGIPEEKKKASFKEEAERFVGQIIKPEHVDEEINPKRIQIFILRKIDRGRTKVVYSRCPDAVEILKCARKWEDAAANLPVLSIGRPEIPFPMEIGEIMNRIWRQDGDQQLDNYRPISSYHGMELFFGTQKQNLEADLRYLVRYSVNMVACIEKINKKKENPIYSIRRSAMLMGMILSWMNVQKEEYMKEYPYLLGQLLKVSDNLHQLYCWHVRNKQMPARLVGNSLYKAVSECPDRGIEQLSQRMIPYIEWAILHPEAKIVKEASKGSEKKEAKYEGPPAGYYRSVYERIGQEISNVISPKSRMNDYEKSLLFIGYLAALPKSNKKMNGVEEHE